MKVSSVLNSKGSDVHTVRPQEAIHSVIKTIKEKSIGALVVSDNYVEAQGMISERDIILGLAEHGGDILTTSATRSCGF